MIRLWILVGFLFYSYTSNAQKICLAEQKTHTVGDFTIEYAEYSGSGEFRPIIILPPTGGKNILDEGYAKTFCQQGMNTVILENWTGFSEDSLDLGLHQRHYERSVKAVDIITSLIDSNEIGLLGTSLGGILGSISIHLNPKISHGFIIAAAGNFHKVIGYSTHPNLMAKKRKRYEEFGFRNVREYVSALDKEITLDPFKIPFDRSSKKLGMVIVQKDNVVPTFNQNETRDLWKPDTVLYMNSRLLNVFLRDKHKAGIVQTYRSYKWNIVNFFK